MSRDYFRLVKKTFGPFMIEHLKDRPITYVEIGCWLGGSASFVAEHCLHHPDSRGYGIDPYTELRRGSVGRMKHDEEQMAIVKETARERLAATGANWTWIYEPSISALTNWSHGTIDALYVDGLHEAHSALLDFTLAWPYLSDGAIVIFDDVKDYKHFAHVREAVNAVQMCFGSLLERLPVETTKQAYFKVRSKEIDQQWWDDQVNGAWCNRALITKACEQCTK